jgi:hypothetical protein
MERNITRTLCSALDPRLPARLVAPHALDVGRLARLDVAPDAAQVREKATEIASALLAAGMDEGRAIRIALARSGRWAERRGLHLLPDE